MKQHAAPIPRVLRSRRDDRYQAGHPAPPKRAESGYVVSVQDDLDTVTVDILGEELTGVVPLGEMPPRGAICEVEARGDLLCIPLWYEGPPPCVMLAATTVFQEPSPDLGTIWSDDNDSTFTVQYGDDGPSAGEWGNYAGAALASYTGSGEIGQAWIHARISATRTDAVPTVSAQFDIYQDSFGPGPSGPHDITYLYSTPDFDIAADGGIEEYVIGIEEPDWAAFQTAMEGQPGIELYFDSWGGSSTGDINRVLHVHEVWLEVCPP